jgi:hypothetical protein
MTPSISRKLYQQFLYLYPEPFRREFRDEMLDIFDACKPAEGYSRLFADAFQSAVKQQLYYHLAPAPEKTLLYAEVPPHPPLAPRLAAVTLGFLLIAAITTSSGVTPQRQYGKARLPPYKAMYFQCSGEHSTEITAERVPSVQYHSLYPPPLPKLEARRRE